MRKATSKAGATANRIGGRIYFGALGSVTAVAALGSAWMAWHALAAGEVIGTVLAGSFALTMVLFTRYCWWPNRRLTDIDP